MKNVRIDIESKTELKKQQLQLGIFFEDLSHAADGGLYGELVQNRSFEFDAEEHEGYHALTAWETVERGDSLIQIHTETASPVHPNNPHYLVMEALLVDEACGIRNQGFNTGIPVQEEREYHFSCFCRLREGDCVPLSIRLEDCFGNTQYAVTEIFLDSHTWKKYECVLKASQTDPNGRLVILAQEPCIIELDMISLFPTDTFCGRRNGLRKDLAEMLSDMKPKFMRFPGGCLVHVGSLYGEDKSSVYRWKSTLGPVEERSSKRNVLWKYNQTFGLGFYEFFLFCEDIGAEPVPVVSAGYDPHFMRIAKTEKMREWIDEALDLIEFANGGEDTKWGKMRVQLGHKESFHLKYLTIGNEEVGEGYFKHYDIITKAVREKYPEIKIINSLITGSWNGKHEGGMEHAKRTKADYTDVHVYGSPEWFIANADSFKSKIGEPRIFFGEYSSRDETWYNALTEAAFLTGLENTDGIEFACYAPLLNNVDYSNWTPNLISYDNHRTFGTPSYYVQKLFMRNQGESVLRAIDDIPSVEESLPPRLTGKLAMKVDAAEVAIRDFTIIDTKNKHIPDFYMDGDHKEHPCEESTGENYTVSFAFTKMKGAGSLSRRGKYAVTLSFAINDGEKPMEWTIDGWQRLSSLGGRLGKGKTHIEYPLVLGRTYQAKLVVEHNKVKAYIDGYLCSDFECRTVVPKDLYYSVVKDQSNDVIVKLVNLQPDEKKVILSLDDETECAVYISSMAGHALDERNSLDEPMKVAPVEKQENIRGGKLEYLVSGHSVHILRFAHQ